MTSEAAVATGVLMIVAVHNTEAHTQKNSVFFFAVNCRCKYRTSMWCYRYIVVFASAHHVEVGPAGREQEALRQQHVHAIQRPNLPAACTDGELRRGLPLLQLLYFTEAGAAKATGLRLLLLLLMR